MPVKCMLLLSWILLAEGRVYGDAADLGVLQEQYRALDSQRDSLEVQRLIVAAEAETLSTRVDSLKLDEENAEELQQSLRSSLGLVRRMVDVDRRLVALDARQDSLEERLRLGYDWEIGVLIQKLSAQADKGLLTQLMVYQEAREQLGAKIYSASWRYGEQMLIAVDDGPDEIQQKLELMEDIDHRLGVEKVSAAELLLRLEGEFRLRTRMGGDKAEGQGADGPVGKTLVFARGDQPGGQVRFRAVSSLDGESDLAGTTVAEVVLEIQKLKTRQQEVRQLQAVVHERAKAFRLYLRNMLEGEE